MQQLPIFPGSTKLTFKQGVEVYRISYYTWRAIDITWRLASRFAHVELVVTSITDSTHKIGSLHYSGEAFDFRTWNFVGAQRFAQALRAVLGRPYDVIVQGDHIHVEYDPKPERYSHAKANGKAGSCSRDGFVCPDKLNRA